MRDSIEQLALRIENQPHLDSAEKLELLGLLANVEKEVDPNAAAEQIESVRESLKLAATVEEKSIPEQLEDKLLELEASHPQTATALGRIAHALSRMGI
jgi:hypothetical protein